MQQAIVLSVIIFLASCNHEKLVNPSDYNALLADAGVISREISKSDNEISFWKKRLAKDTGSFVDMIQIALLHMNRFKLSGDVHDLLSADSLLQQSAAKLNHTDPDIYLTFSQNNISLHRFGKAYHNILHADSLGAGAYESSLLQFDAAMELGLYQVAASKLKSIINKDGFDYLVRKAKLEDHNGNLEKAIQLMETALQKAEAMKKKPVMLWARSNLADMYGHAGRISEAYDLYLQVLKADSSYLHALKGIAWIAFSHDKNCAEAKRILHYILSQTKLPDPYLFLAEIAEWENEKELKDHYIRRFAAEAEKPAYGDMYNKYLVALYAEEFKDYEKAMNLAMTEINNRPAPETYEWLAWVYYQKGDISKAYEIVSRFVISKTFEPGALLHVAYILQASGKPDEAAKIFRECLDASFELGPVAIKQLRLQAKSI